MIKSKNLEYQHIISFNPLYFHFNIKLYRTKIDITSRLVD
jgi:hypothetical protein